MQSSRSPTPGVPAAAPRWYNAGEPCPGSPALAYTAYSLPYVLAAACVLAVTPFVWRRRVTPGAAAFAGVMVSAAMWSLGNAVEVAAVRLSDKVLAANLEYIGILAVPALWLISSLQYTGRWDQLPRRSCWLLAIVPLVTIALLWLPGHQLMRFDIRLDPVGPTPLVRYGPWFYISAFYNYSLLLAGASLLIDTLSHSHHVFRAQATLLVLAALLPIVASLAHVLSLGPLPFLDLAPPTFAISAIIMALGVFRFRMFELLPAARGAVMDAIAEAVLVLDRGGAVVDANAAASAIVGRGRALIGRPASALLPAEAAALVARHQPGSHHFALNEDGQERRFDLTLSALRAGNEAAGWVVVLQDVTERETLIRDLQTALSRIDTLQGLIPICASCKRVRDDQGYWQQVEAYVSAHTRAQFTHGVCPECIARIYPEDDGDR